MGLYLPIEKSMKRRSFQCQKLIRSTWFAEGGYEPITEVLFNELNVDAYFLEYDDERSGDFAPLRFVPDGKTVVLGLVTTKLPDLEPSRDLIQRIKKAGQYLPLENMCLSPQCGFSSFQHLSRQRNQRE
jgi:5-methyltetrahydropteroyltriglutamate--homocysteine methyltransferase